MDMVHISVGEALSVALQGYVVVFIGLVLLMLVIMGMSRIMIARSKKSAALPVTVTPMPAAPAEKAPGSAGELKLYDTDPKAAAMCMAIVAEQLQKPLNELRFISIREVKDDEI